MRTSEAQWVPRMLGRTPWSARVPLGPLPDGGVGCGPGGPPHHQCTIPGSAKTKAYATLACLTLHREAIETSKKTCI